MKALLHHCVEPRASSSRIMAASHNLCGACCLKVADDSPEGLGEDKTRYAELIEDMGRRGARTDENLENHNHLPPPLPLGGEKSSSDLIGKGYGCRSLRLSTCWAQHTCPTVQQSDISGEPLPTCGCALRKSDSSFITRTTWGNSSLYAAFVHIGIPTGSWTIFVRYDCCTWRHTHAAANFAPNHTWYDYSLSHPLQIEGLCLVHATVSVEHMQCMGNHSSACDTLTHMHHDCEVHAHKVADQSNNHLSRKRSGCCSQCRRHWSASWNAGLQTPPNAPWFTNVHLSKSISQRCLTPVPPQV